MRDHVRRTAIAACLSVLAFAAPACATHAPTRSGGEHAVTTTAPFMEMLARRDRELAAADPRRARMGGHGTLGIASVTPDRDRVPVYQTVEFAADCTGEWTNPFNPDDARLDALVTGPDGRESVVPGFYMVGYERSRRHDGAEVLTETGRDGWRVRFTPLSEGWHTVRLRFSDGTGEVLSEPVRVVATPAQGRGFVRRSAQEERYLRFDDGSLFFPTGLNHGWPGAGATYDYDDTLGRTAANRGNTVRVWLAPTFHRLSLETSERFDDNGLMGGLGWINQDAAWRFDHVLDRAEELGVEILPVAFSFSGWRSANGPSNWKESPYNAANGGPMTRASDVFTDPVARELARRRLRYIVARYGHSTGVMAWELWNEVTGVDDYDDAKSSDWHREMAAYVKSIDPYEHLVTTSTWWTEGTPRIDGLDDIDISMTHEYNAPDHAIPHYGAARWKPDTYHKPHLTGEFGNQEFDSGDSGVYDPETISVHNVLWASLTGGSCGGGLYWYWEIGNKAGWHGLFKPLADFVDDLPLNTVDFEPFKPEIQGYAGIALPPMQGDGVVRLPAGAASWTPGEINRPHTIAIDASGFTDTPWMIPGVLHAALKKDLANPATFTMHFVRPGNFSVRVGTVSGWGGAGLRFELDGRAAGEHDFADKKPNDRNEDPAYRGLYSIEVPAGEHTVRVSCPKGDWVRVSFEADGLLDRSSVPLWATGRRRDGAAPGEVAGFFWLRHRDYSWGAERSGAQRKPVSPVRMRLEGFGDGNYVVEWTDTRTGASLGELPATARDGVIQIVTPMIDESAAAKVRRR